MLLYALSWQPRGESTVLIAVNVVAVVAVVLW